jgi:hypothetical protein
VNGDGWVTPLDVLLVINYLNQRSLVAGEGEAAVADGLTSPAGLPADPPATGVSSLILPVPGIKAATTMFFSAVPEPQWSLPPLSSRISSDPKLPILTQARRSPAQRSESYEAFGDDWDATSGELEDALADIAGEVGLTWQQPADGH